MRQLKFWLEIDEEKHIYQKVRLETISHGEVNELQITNLETNSSYNPPKCMSLTGTWLPIRSASNRLVKRIPMFWMPMYALREGSCTGTNAGHKLHGVSI